MEDSESVSTSLNADELDKFVSPLLIPSIVMNDGELNYFPDLSSRNSKVSLNDKGKKGQRSLKKSQDKPLKKEGQKKRCENASVDEFSASSERELGIVSRFDFRSAEASPDQRHSAMERADISPYSSDAWDINSDSDSDHTDSSDDDDPRSQVDRLIERGTLMYMDGENSALSSEDDSDDDDYDSESDITDVSPLVSANSSPIGLSPVLPRRSFTTSPLALHDNHTLQFECNQNQGGDYNEDLSEGSSPNEDALQHSVLDNHNATNMDLLLRAVLELENKTRTDIKRNNFQGQEQHIPSPGLPIPNKDNMFLHPIRDNPHHHHLRKNMSFSNEEVRKIDRENKILLKKIMNAHTRSRPHCGQSTHTSSKTHRPSNSAVNRRKAEERIRKENLYILKKIQEAKPSKELERINHTSHCSNEATFQTGPPHGLRASCGAFLRNMTQPDHVAVQRSRKETAL